MKKDKVYIEKETIMKEVSGDKVSKTTIRIFIASEGKTRTICFTPAQFVKFRQEINNVNFT